MLPSLKKIDIGADTFWDNKLIWVVRDVYSVLTKTNILVKENLWRVPPAQLIKSGEVFFMYTCLDFTLTTWFFLRKMGISGQFVINELEGKWWPKIHFGIETPHGFVDHVIWNSVILWSGELPNFYEPMKWEIQTQRHRVGLWEIDDDDTIFDIVQKTGLKIELLSEQTAQKLWDQFERDNTPEVWQAFINKAGSDIKKPTLFLKDY